MTRICSLQPRPPPDTRGHQVGMQPAEDVVPLPLPYGTMQDNAAHAAAKLFIICVMLHSMAICQHLPLPLRGAFYGVPELGAEQCTVRGGSGEAGCQREH